MSVVVSFEIELLSTAKRGGLAAPEQTATCSESTYAIQLT